VIRYISAFNERDQEHVKGMDGAFVIDTSIPDVPYFVIQIKILRFEPTHGGINRPQAIWIVRLVRALGDIWKSFKKNYST